MTDSDVISSLNGIGIGVASTVCVISCKVDTSQEVVLVFCEKDLLIRSRVRSIASMRCLFGSEGAVCCAEGGVVLVCGVVGLMITGLGLVWGDNVMVCMDGWVSVCLVSIEADELNWGDGVKLVWDLAWCDRESRENKLLGELDGSNLGV